MKLSEIMKIATLVYWRYSKHHMMGGIECKNADVLTVNRSFMLTESEIKISIADMRREVKTKRYKHLRMNGGLPSLCPVAHYFYFVVPEALKDKALSVCDDIYPYAGLLIFKEGDVSIYSPSNIICMRQSKRFNRKKVEGKELLQVGYGISNTATSYIRKYLELSNHP